jgi:hypothetical protein
MNIVLPPSSSLSGRPSNLVRNPSRPATTFPGWGPKIGI